MREFILKNGINVCVKKNLATPRVALTLNLSITKEEKIAGQYSLMNRLLMKGTKKYSSEELATILEENAIELSSEMKSDYLRFRIVCLNEDFEKALEILQDIILNSTFKEFDKEKTKLKGELTAELDSARVKISDLFTKNIYKNHYYGHSYTQVLENINKITQKDVITAYNYILENSKKVLTLVGDVDENIINKYFETLPKSQDIDSSILEPTSIKQKKVELIKEDANQAQIIQGWKVPTIGNNDYPVLMLINIILGASGLSSRLFLELREKKGLAYTVRSSFETHLKSAVFSIYIGTEPSNIETSIEGFKEEIEKIKNILVSEEELKNAKNNLIGKQQFITETNSQQANSMAYYSIMGKNFNYLEDLIKKIQQVTPKEIKECANKYFNDDYILAILKP